jgi:uncharacterized OsmC-like protein
MLPVNPRVKEVADRQIKERSAGPRAESPRPVTTVKSWALGDLQFRATVEGHSFVSDEGEHGAGRDAAPAPLRYFLAGIVMCHEVWTVKSAVVLGIELEKLECEISGYVGPGGPGEPDDASAFSRLTYRMSIHSPAAAEQIKTIVDQAARRCPAFATARRAVPIELTLQHNGSTIEERVYGPSN